MQKTTRNADFIRYIWQEIKGTVERVSALVLHNTSTAVLHNTWRSQPNKGEVMILHIILCFHCFHKFSEYLASLLYITKDLN